MAADYNILVLGQARAGKKKLIGRLVNHTYGGDTYIPATGVESAFLHVTPLGSNDKDSTVRCAFSILAGGERNQYTRDAYLRQAELVIYCVDLSEEVNDSSIKTIQNEIDSLKAKAPQCKIMLVGTKSDLNSDRHKIKSIAERLTGFDELEVTSAKRNDNVSAIYNRLAKDCSPIQAHSAEGTDSEYFSSDLKQLIASSEWNKKGKGFMGISFFAHAPDYIESMRRGDNFPAVKALAVEALEKQPFLGRHTDVSRLYEAISESSSADEAFEKYDAYLRNTIQNKGL